MAGQKNPRSRDRPIVGSVFYDQTDEGVSFNAGYSQTGRASFYLPLQVKGNKILTKALITLCFCRNSNTYQVEGVDMLSWLKFCCVAITIVALSGCAPAGIQQRSQASIELDQIDSAKRDCDAKAQQFDSLKRECIASKDPACVARLEQLASEMQQDSSFLLGKATYSSNFNIGNVASLATRICGEQACRSKLETGDAYANIGDKENAKRVYRYVITTFTGTVYTGFVKKAEFALEDLLEFSKN